MQNHFFLGKGELRLLIEDDPKVLRVPQMFLAYINPKINVVKNFYEVAFNRLIFHLPIKKNPDIQKSPLEGKDSRYQDKVPT